MIIDNKHITVNDGGALEGLSGLALGLEYFREQLRGMLSSLKDCGENQNEMVKQAKRFKQIVQQNNELLEELKKGIEFFFC